MKANFISLHLKLLLLFTTFSEGRSSFVPSPLRACQVKTFFFTRPGADASTSHGATSTFLSEVEQTVQRVLKRHESTNDILDLPPAQRESLGVARNLDTRLQAFKRNNDCPRCWLQRAHCVCEKCPPLPQSSLPRNVRRIFLLMHHKEICLAVDTAKMILAAFPDQCELVVAGIGPEYQRSMADLLAVTQDNKCLVLFPDENAQTFQDLMIAQHGSETENNISQWDVVVIDGTWAQARKMYARYIPTEVQGGPSRIQLSQDAVNVLALGQLNTESTAQKSILSGHQLRRHPVKWREVSTLEATRLLLGDMAIDNEVSCDSGSYPWDDLAQYQLEADLAAKRQLGPPRNSRSSSEKVQR